LEGGKRIRHTSRDLKKVRRRRGEGLEVRGRKLCVDKNLSSLEGALIEIKQGGVSGRMVRQKGISGSPDRKKQRAGLTINFFWRFYLPESLRSAISRQQRGGGGRTRRNEEGNYNREEYCPGLKALSGGEQRRGNQDSPRSEVNPGGLKKFLDQRALVGGAKGANLVGTGVLRNVLRGRL